MTWVRVSTVVWIAFSRCRLDIVAAIRKRVAASQARISPSSMLSASAPNLSSSADRTVFLLDSFAACRSLISAMPSDVSCISNNPSLIRTALLNSSSELYVLSSACHSQCIHYSIRWAEGNLTTLTHQGLIAVTLSGS